MYGCDGAAPSDSSAQQGDYPQSAGWAAPWVPDVPVFPLDPDPYASLTPAELVAFGIGPARAPDDDDDDEEEEANDNEVTEDDE
jgi:hypothetical protein